MSRYASTCPALPSVTALAGTGPAVDHLGGRTPRRPRGTALLVSLLLVVFGVTAGATAQPEDDGTPEITNSTCPVEVGEAVDPEQWVDYRGQRVYVCCRMCKVKFERDPEAYTDNLPAFMRAAWEGGDATDEQSHAPEPEHAQEADHAHSDDEAGHGHDDAAADDTGTAAGDEDHDHSAHEREGARGGPARLIGWLGNFHPPAVNFPIALLVSAAFAELLLMLTGRPVFEAAARFCVWVGSVTAMVAVVLGWFFAGFRWSDPDWIMTVHRWLGTGAGVWAIVVLGLSIAAHRSQDRGLRWRRLYHLALLVGAASVAVNGFFGGAMIYGLDHYAF